MPYPVGFTSQWDILSPSMGSNFTIATHTAIFNLRGNVAARNYMRPIVRNSDLRFIGKQSEERKCIYLPNGNRKG